MSLVDRLEGFYGKAKNAGKALALAGILASPVYDSRCEGMQPGPLHPSRLLFDGTTLSRDYREMQQGQMIVIPRQNEFFTANYFKGDLNNNGDGESFEFEGYNKITFRKSERVEFVAKVYNKPGSTITFKLYKKDTWEKIQEDRVFISSNSAGWRFYKDKSEKNEEGILSPGDYIGSVEIDGKTTWTQEIKIVN